MVINQGDVFWVDVKPPMGSEPGFRRPHVVIQNNVMNHTRIATTVVCALTTNLQRAAAPGNVLLARDEANLPKPSIVNVSQVLTLDKTKLQEKIGTLSRSRVREILDGFRLITEPQEIE